MADDERTEHEEGAEPPAEGMEAGVPVGEPLAEEPLDEAPLDEDLGDEGPPPGGSVEELMIQAEADRRRANAAMSLVHKEHYAFLLANCLFFAGALAAWRAAPYGDNNLGAALTHGLETIRGSVIFALSIYGFCTLAIGLYTKRTVVWPFALNMLLGLWVGLGGVIRAIGGAEWDNAYTVLEKQSHTKLDSALAGLSTIPPGYWMLAGGSLLVLFILVKGIVGGAAKGKRKAAPAGRGARS
jgi:hypothetical protein